MAYIEAVEQDQSHNYSEQHTDCEVFQYVAVFYNVFADYKSITEGIVRAPIIYCERLELVASYKPCTIAVHTSVESLSHSQS